MRPSFPSVVAGKRLYQMSFVEQFIAGALTSGDVVKEAVRTQTTEDGLRRLGLKSSAEYDEIINEGPDAVVLVAARRIAEGRAAPTV